MIDKFQERRTLTDGDYSWQPFIPTSGFYTPLAPPRGEKFKAPIALLTSPEENLSQQRMPLRLVASITLAAYGKVVHCLEAGDFV